MNKKYFVYPYTQNSAGAIMLAEELDGKRVLLNNSTYVYKPLEHILINWGNGNCPFPNALNPASAINDVINKVTFFKKLEGVGVTPPFATSKAAAANLSFPVVCRTTTEGHDGQGIVIAETVNQLVNAPLYTSYIDKTSEYRVHLGRLPSGDTSVIALQKKVKTEGFTGDQRIWVGGGTQLNLADNVPHEVMAACWTALASFPKLHFAAFDVVYDNSTGNAYVLEINSAPVLFSSTAQAYAKFFKTYNTVTQTAAPQETVTMPPAHTPTTPAPAPQLTGNFTAIQLIKAQIAAGHISKQTLETYMPPITEEMLIANYVSKIL